MEIAKNNNLNQQPSFGRELLRKIDQTTETQIAHKAFKEFIAPHLKFIDVICAKAIVPYQEYFSHITEELNNQLLVALYQNPARLLKAVKGLKNPEIYREQLRLEIARIAKKVLNNLLKDERAYKKIVRPLNPVISSRITADEEANQENELAIVPDFTDKDNPDAINQQNLPIYKEPIYDPDEALIVSKDYCAFFREVLATMIERDRLILMAILPYLEKGSQLPKEVRQKLTEQFKLSHATLSKQIDRIKRRFEQKAKAMKQENESIL